MIKNKVLLLGGNFLPEPTGIGKFNGEMIEWLTSHGYLCTVVTTYPYYPYWQVQQPYLKTSYSFRHEIKNLMSHYATPIEIYRCPQYVPKKPTGVNRILLDLTFFITSFIVVFKLLFHKKFDYVISVVPSFQIGLLAMFYKSIKGGKFLYHIQDLQIETARDLKMIRFPILINMLFKVENFILKNADVVSSISTGMIKQVEKKCNRNVVLFPNWVDTRSFFPLADKSEIRKEYGLKSSDKIVLYSGAIGEKQGLEIILNAAKSLSNHKEIKFIICGLGPYLEKLRQLRQRLDLHNVIFMPLQPAKKLNRFLNMADLHLVVQKADANDLVMPSKLTNILAIGGIALVTASPGSSLFKTISTYKMAVLASPENLDSLTESIRCSLFNNNETVRMNARSYAEDYLSIDKVMLRYSNNMAEESEVQLADFQFEN